MIDVLDHYVAFKARPGQEQALSAVLKRFVSAISGQLTCVLDISAGANISKSGLAQGYTHGCYVRLTDPESLVGGYWNHPAHQELLAEIDAVCAERFAVDFTREA
ncbi:MAG TPA: Dabb family protein [Trebonia sp.]|nr:Dabb family protein [Trebonia sp.]